MCNTIVIILVETFNKDFLCSVIAIVLVEIQPICSCLRTFIEGLFNLFSYFDKKLPNFFKES